MTENDIYDSKGTYDRFVEKYKLLAIKLKTSPDRIGKQKYFVRNPENLIYFKKLSRHSPDRNFSCSA